MCFLPDRPRVKTQGASEVEVAIEKSFSANADGQAEGDRNASLHAGDGATFVALLELENEEERDLFRRRAPTS